MNRIVAPFATAAALIMVLAPVGAAQAPSPEVMTAFSGTWKIDHERSEPLPPVARSLVGPTRMVPRDSTIAETVIISGTGTPPTGGGSRRGGAAAGGMGGTPPAMPGGRTRGGRGGAMGRYLAEMATELAPPPTLVISASDAEVVLANTAGAEIRWATDGKVHQEAQMDGTMLEQSAAWKGDKIELHNAVHGSLDLKRELRLIDKGTALEIKIELSGAGMQKKVTRKVIYTR